MKVVAIDIETTGVNIQKDQIVEFGAVLFDLSAPKFEAKYFHKSIYNPRIEGSPFAINMNIDKIIFAENANNKLIKLAKSEEKEFSNCTKLKDILSYSDTLAEEFAVWLKQNDAYEEGSRSINVCGKNAAGFDIPFCKNFFKDFDYLIRYKRRIFYPHFINFLSLPRSWA